MTPAEEEARWATMPIQHRPERPHQDCGCHGGWHDQCAPPDPCECDRCADEAQAHAEAVYARFTAGKDTTP